MWLELICDQSWNGIIYDANVSWNLAIGHLDQNCGGEHVSWSHLGANQLTSLGFKSLQVS